MNILRVLEKIFHFESRLRVIKSSDVLIIYLYFADSMKLVFLLNGMTLSLGKYEKIYKECLISSVGCENRYDLQILCCNKNFPILDILG